MFPLLAIAAIVAVVLVSRRTSSSSSSSSAPPGPPPPPPVTIGALYNWGVPLAPPAGRVWPVVTSDPKRLSIAYRDAGGVLHEGITTQRYFGASREGGVRRHAGIDLVANPGDPIVAMEDGRVLGVAGGYLGLDAVVVEHVSGVAGLYGEVAVGSLAAAGLKAGDLVKAGQRIATMGASSTGSHMLHLELWDRAHAPKHFTPWHPSAAVPVGLYDPTAYLRTLAAQQGGNVA